MSRSMNREFFDYWRFESKRFDIPITWDAYRRTMEFLAINPPGKIATKAEFNYLVLIIDNLLTQRINQSDIQDIELVRKIYEWASVYDWDSIYADSYNGVDDYLYELVHDVYSGEGTGKMMASVIRNWMRGTFDPSTELPDHILEKRVDDAVD